MPQSRQNHPTSTREKNQMAKPVVFVIGASGNVGSATLQVLSSKYADKVEIRAGVRNPDKADKLKSLPNVSVVQAEMGDKEKLKSTLKGVHTLYIVTPGVENRAQLTIATAQAAKEAGVKHLLVVSVPLAALTDTVFGQQFSKIETGVSQLGVPYTILRLAFFFDSFIDEFKDGIKTQGAIYSPADGTKPFTMAAVQDIAKAGAVILVDPTKHVNKTYIIVSDRHTHNDVAAAFSEALGKTVTYNRMPYDAAKQIFAAIGFPKWRADAGMEFYKLVDDGSPVTNVADTSHFHQITGEQPTSFKTWVSQVKSVFQ